MSDTLNPLTCFPREVRQAQTDYTEAPTYKNREQILYERWEWMQYFLYNKELKLTSKADSNTKFRAQADYKIVDGKLYRKADEKHEFPRYAVAENDVFDVIVKEHL